MKQLTASTIVNKLKPFTQEGAKNALTKKEKETYDQALLGLKANSTIFNLSFMKQAEILCQTRGIRLEDEENVDDKS